MEPLTNNWSVESLIPLRVSHQYLFVGDDNGLVLLEFILELVIMSLINDCYFLTSFGSAKTRK